MRQLARSFPLAVFLAIGGWFTGGLAGCRSAYVQTTVLNSGSSELHNIEIDYPNASFGISNLAPGAKFQYRFQIQDAGWVKVKFFDNAKHRHFGKGPYLAEGQRGTLIITLTDSKVAQWQAELRPKVVPPAGSSGSEKEPLE